MAELQLPTDDEVKTYGGGLRTPWPTFYEQVSQSWRRGQSVSVLGQNGSGKSHLMRHLLELWKDARVLLIDTKAGDDLWRTGFSTPANGTERAGLRRDSRPTRHDHPGGAA
jgi:energy-coupling factor transporter ATP-binding protein EcfA2